MNVLDNSWLDYMSFYQFSLLKIAQATNKIEFQQLEEKLLKIRNTIEKMPTYWDIAEAKAEDITVGLHYTINGNYDWYLATVNTVKRSEPSFGFARLDNDYYNAELGSIYIPELIQYPVVELDLDWNTDTTLRNVMDENKKLLYSSK